MLRSTAFSHSLSAIYLTNLPVLFRKIPPEPKTLGLLAPLTRAHLLPQDLQLGHVRSGRVQCHHQPSPVRHPGRGRRSQWSRWVDDVIGMATGRPGTRLTVVIYVGTPSWRDLELPLCCCTFSCSLSFSYSLVQNDRFVVAPLKPKQANKLEAIPFLSLSLTPNQLASWPYDPVTRNS